jgi:hypothetical protein
MSDDEKFQLAKTGDGQPLPPELVPGTTGLSDLIDNLFGERIYLTHVKVTGYWYLSDAEKEYYRAAGVPGTKLKLLRDPNNKYDTYAIKILDENNHHLGWIPRNQNHIIARLMDSGKMIVGETSEDGNALDGELMVGIWMKE